MSSDDSVEEDPPLEAVAKDLRKLVPCIAAPATAMSDRVEQLFPDDAIFSLVLRRRLGDTLRGSELGGSSSETSFNRGLLVGVYFPSGSTFAPRPLLRCIGTAWRHQRRDTRGVAHRRTRGPQHEESASTSKAKKAETEAVPSVSAFWFPTWDLHAFAQASAACFRT